MIIKLSPYAPLPGSDERLVLARVGEVLTVNGQSFHFTPLPEGGELPAEAIGSERFAGPVVRREGAQSSACGCRWLTALAQPLAFLNER